MPSHMRDPNAPDQTGSQPAQGVPEVQGTTGTQGVPAAQPPRQPSPSSTGQRFATEDRPSSYASDPQEIEIPERKGPRLWWAWLILAIIVIVGIIWIWLFVIPHPEGSYEDIQGVEGQEQVEEGATGEGEYEGVSELGVGSQGPNTIRTASGLDWTIDPQGLLAPVEIHGVSNSGVTIAFLPGDGSQNVTVRFLSLSVGGQTYDVGAPDSPVHYNITAGHEGERDITGDPTFTVGVDETGTFYGERVLISVDGLDENGYNGMVLTLEETGADGTPVQGMISLSSAPATAAPAQDQQAAPAEGQPVEEQPVEGQPVEGQPVEEQPAPEQ